MAAAGEPPTAPWAPDEQAAGDFALAADAAPVPMWTTRPDGTRGFVNRAYCELVGLGYADALRLEWRDLIHPDDVERVRADTAAGVASGETFSIEGRFRHADGGWRWIRAVTRPRPGPDGAPLGFVGVGHDVTDAKTAELALRSRERQLSTLIDQTAAGLAQIDLTGRFTMVNDRFCEMVGRSRDELLATTARAITHADDQARNDVQFAALIREGRALSTDKRYVRPDGTAVWVSNSAALIRDEQGQPWRLTAISLDITARREAEAAVRANEARLEFLDALTRATATLIDADTVLAVTTRMLGERLRASDCAYADMDADGDTFYIRGDWHADGVASIVGTYALASFGSIAVADLNAGRPLVIDDVAAIEGDGAAAFRAIGIRATICMPYLKGDRLAALMAVHAATPRPWTDAELALVREVTERSWAQIERVRAEAALRDSERQLRLAVEGARIGTWDWDPVTQRGGWSPRAAEIMGVPHDKRLTQREQAAMIHPDDRDRVLAGSAALAVSGSDFATEYRIVRPDGAVRWIASHGLVMRDEAGTATRVIGTIRDVTERREAQEALTALNRTLADEIAVRTAERDRMWRLSRDLLLVVDLRRRIRAVNPAIELLGYRQAEVVGHGLLGYVHPDDRAATAAAMRTVAAAPIGEFAARLKAKDGGWRHFIWSAAPGEGEAYVIGRDATAETQRRDELEQAQEALRQAQKVESLGQLTGGVAHDFNNLLTPIIGNLDLLGRRADRDGEDDERQRRLIRGALESAERARVLVQRLLAFARRQPLRPGPVDLGALVGGIQALVESTVGPQVAVSVAVDRGLPPAQVDENQLELAILNLAVNARDAMVDGGRLRLATGLAAPDAVRRAGLAGDFLSLSVADTGIGMNADIAARAVEPFFSTKGVGKGTGLGLSMVHGLALQLGGAMLLDSAPGRGTRIELLLPVATDAVGDAAAELAPPPTGAGRVLLVDDEAAVRDATADMLASLGFEVATATSGEEALPMLDVADYLVTDHLMPGMKGAALARTALKRRPGLKVLVVSGYAALDEIPPELPRLAKPFRLDELARQMGSLA